MTRRDIARQRLRNQRITGPIRGTPADVVGWLGAVQAQDYAGAKWALGLRLRGATDADVERAFNDGAILRTHLLRPTWHFVTPADIRWMLALTTPRVHAVNGTRYRQLELGSATFERSNDALARALEGGEHLTRDELRVVLRRAGIETDAEQRMAYLMMRAELDGIVCSGPRRGRQFTYALLDERAPRARTLPREEALAELARRYFTSRGPATVRDFAKWSGLTLADARTGLEVVKARLRHEVVDGRTYWLASRRSRAAVSPAAHLLSIYDEFVSGYKDRSAMIDEGHAERLSGMGNALAYIVVVDGRIVGTWRRALRKDSVVIEIAPFAPLTRAQNRAVAAAADRYASFLSRSAILA